MLEGAGRVVLRPGVGPVVGARFELGDGRQECVPDTAVGPALGTIGKGFRTRQTSHRPGPERATWQISMLTNDTRIPGGEGSTGCDSLGSGDRVLAEKVVPGSVTRGASRG